jgi:hypothetical protein
MFYNTELEESAETTYIHPADDLMGLQRSTWGRRTPSDRI